jgi:hypothetical protein
VLRVKHARSRSSAESDVYIFFAGDVGYGKIIRCVSRRMIGGGAGAPSMHDHDGTRAMPSADEKEAHRRMFRVTEDDRVAAESASSRNFQSGLGIHLRLVPLRRLVAPVSH